MANIYKGNFNTGNYGKQSKLGYLVENIKNTDNSEHLEIPVKPTTIALLAMPLLILKPLRNFIGLGFLMIAIYELAKKVENNNT